MLFGAYFGRTASAVPWMKAWIFTTSSSVSLPEKSGLCAPSSEWRNARTFGARALQNTAQAAPKKSPAPKGAGIS